MTRIEPNLPRLIALGGLMEAGKDTVADHLVEAHGYAKIEMSKNVHACLLALNPMIYVTVVDEVALTPNEVRALKKHWSEGRLTYVELHAALGYVRMKRVAEVRRLLRAMGTEVGRNVLSPDLWISLVADEIRDLWSQGRPVVITGVRFHNERDRLLDEGALLVWVERPALPSETAPEGAKVPDAHPSESTLDRSAFDHLLVNDGSVADLRRAADGWLRSQTNAGGAL